MYRPGSIKGRGCQEGDQERTEHKTCQDARDARRCAGIVVLQPDVLLSGTRISGSFKCARQSVLEERFGGDSNARAVEGTLLHDLLQACASIQLTQ